jgi:hypothetical protein
VLATNGHRRLHIEPKQTAGGMWYGIYVHHSESAAEHPLVKGALTRLQNVATSK